MSMTPRERWLALLQRKTPDRIPADYQATPEVTARLLGELGCAGEEELWRRLHVDKRRVLEPAWRPRRGPLPPDEDMWGVRFRKVRYAARAVLEQLDNVRFVGRAADVEDKAVFHESAPPSWTAAIFRCIKSGGTYLTIAKPAPHARKAATT